MKYIILFLFLASCSHAPECAVHRKDENYSLKKSLSLVTYNAHNMPWTRTKFSEIAEKLKDTDVVLMQEVFSDYDDASCMMYQGYQSKKREDSYFGDGLARYSYGQFTAYARQEWGSCHGFLRNDSDCLVPKGYSVALHQLEQRGVLIFNVHFEAGETHLEDLIRANQKLQLLNEILQYQLKIIKGEEPSYPIIIAGDFNDEDMSIFANACGKQSCGFIDKVFYLSNYTTTLKPVSWKRRLDFVGEDGVPYSDHYPIEVIFEWEQNDGR